MKNLILAGSPCRVDCSIFIFLDNAVVEQVLLENLELVSELTENASILQNNKKILFDARSKLIADQPDVVDVDLKTDSEVRPLQHIFK